MSFSNSNLPPFVLIAKFAIPTISSHFSRRRSSWVLIRDPVPSDNRKINKRGLIHLRAPEPLRIISSYVVAISTEYLLGELSW
ncbi:hypothetical protein CEXT_392641 [Caerostris extrusa]|uniref:Uncharacterized protein n=1 Tax=Caerostris extrusa TaxID=172846 RepID=A0AAV4W5R4_CAEEX|nr:hypothetical protein CEXT_392641 [Caerostris extrusa]